MRLRDIVYAGVFSTMAGTAGAAVIDFTDPASVDIANGTFSGGGITGTMSASVENCWGCTATIIQDASAGLGVVSYNGDDQAIDGVFDETLSFDFGEIVELISVTFGWWDGEDDATINPANGSLVVNGDSTATFTFDAPTLVQVLDVTADDALGGGGACYLSVKGSCLWWELYGPDDFSVKSVKFERTGNNGDPDVVPLPAGGLLLLTGLAGLAIARRRRA